MLRMTRREAFLTGFAGCAAVASQGILAASNEDRISQIRAIDVSDFRDDNLPHGICTRDPYFRSKGDSAFVIDGCLLAVYGNVSPERRRDVVMALLLAQRAATKKFDRFTKPTEWYGTFQQVLDNIGMVVKQIAFAPYQHLGESFTIPDDVLPPLFTGASAPSLKLIRTTVDAVNDVSDDDERPVLFDSSTLLNGNGSALLGILNESSGVATVRIGAIQYSSVPDVVRSLTFGFPSDKTTMRIASQELTLNDEVFGPLREVIADKVKDQVKIRVKNQEF